MAPLSHFVLAAMAALGAHAASSVLDLIPDNFDSVILKSNKPALVEFFAPWCGHCKNLAPVYEELAADFDFAKDKVSIAKVDADAEKELGKRFGVQGFPTLKWFDGKSQTPEDYTGGRDLDSLKDFIVEKTGIKMKRKKVVPSPVEYLNDESWKTKIGGDQDAIVAFTTSWCGRKFLLRLGKMVSEPSTNMILDCKKLAPVWESLTNAFAAESNVLIAKVDCEAPNAKAIAADQGVKSYPTIKYFPKGSKEAVDYAGGRTEADFVEFMNEKAGTHRMVGGGLDNKAGTIDALDSIVSTMTGSNMAEIQDQLTKASANLKDKYAEYYIKVANKLKQNQGYVEKELARLEGLIHKGGLAPGKLDDLTSRSNILRKFKGEERPVEKEL